MVKLSPFVSTQQAIAAKKRECEREQKNQFRQIDHVDIIPIIALARRKIQFENSNSIKLIHALTQTHTNQRITIVPACTCALYIIWSCICFTTERETMVKLYNIIRWQNKMFIYIIICRAPRTKATHWDTVWVITNERERKKSITSTTIFSGMHAHIGKKEKSFIFLCITNEYNDNKKTKESVEKIAMKYTAPCDYRVHYVIYTKKKNKTRIGR